MPRHRASSQRTRPPTSGRARFSLLPTTYYLPPPTYYLLPTTYYLLPSTTYHLPPTTYYLPPTTYYLLPTTYYRLTTHYLPGERAPAAGAGGDAAVRCLRLLAALTLAHAQAGNELI